MDFRILTEQDKQIYRETMREMMQASDREFVPPLSARFSTTQKTLAGLGASGDVTPYFTEMLRQEIIAAFEDGELIGYLSYRLDYTSDVIAADTLPNVYLSTLISRPSARGRGLTAGLYRRLFYEVYPSRSIFTRTWSTNAAHIHILLEKFGFRELARVRDDRGAGIDTVYFMLERRADGEEK